MEPSKWSRLLVLGSSWLVASCLLYIGVAAYLFDPGGRHVTLLEIAVPLLLFILPALLLTYRLGWILHQPKAPESKGRHLYVTIPLSLLGVVLGAILISIAIWRENWVELFWH